MDVVTKNIEAVGGSVQVESCEGIGTTITLKIPLTLAIIAGALKPASLRAALEGIDVAYYLVHSMAAGGEFASLDREAAANFRDAAAAAGVGRIIYLGGLRPSEGRALTFSRGMRPGKSSGADPYP